MCIRIGTQCLAREGVSERKGKGRKGKTVWWEERKRGRESCEHFREGRKENVHVQLGGAL